MKLWNLKFKVISIICLVVLAGGCGGSEFNAPTGVSATGGKTITVDWDALPGLCYNIYWNTTDGVTKDDNLIEDVTPPYEHSGLIYNGTTYYYAVSAFSCPGLTESPLSAEVSAVSNFPGTELIKLTASDAVDVEIPYGAYSDYCEYFGSSVAISGDYIIVGTPDEDGAALNRGAAYIFYRNQGGTDNWGQVKKLFASDVAEWDRFGISVSISGDYAIVGAHLEEGASTDPHASRGAAYVFHRNQGGTDNWGEVKKLTASDTEDHDYFGMSLSISGDYVIVGAPYEDGAGDRRGAAYMYHRNQGGTDNWGEVKKLTASDAEDTDYFGMSLSISGDYAIVGAHYKDGAGDRRGAAYVFHRNQGGTDNWGEVKKLTASDAENEDFFGASISISGAYAIVGSYKEDGDGTQRGAAYVFHRNHGGTDNWGEVRKLTAFDAEDDDFFGTSVSISGDDIIVGAPYEDGNFNDGLNRGAAYIF